jgi:hypothetical protein
MGVDFYNLDNLVFNMLTKHNYTRKDQFEFWQAEASTITDYIATWGVVRFWAVSRSYQSSKGNVEQAIEQSDHKLYENDYKRKFLAWKIARLALCEILDRKLKIEPNLTTQEFDKNFTELPSHEQATIAELLIEIGDAIQFWKMRIKDANKSNSTL